MNDEERSRRAPRAPWPTATVATLRSLYTMTPASAPRWPIALQAAVAIAAPIAVLTLLGRPELGYQAATGAFTALHVSHLRPRERAKVLPVVAVVLVVGAAFGVLCSASIALSLIGLVVMTVAAGAFAYGFRLGPPGALFLVLVYGMAAYVPTVAPVFHPVEFLGALAAGCAFSYVVATAPLLLPRVRAEGARPMSELLPAPVWDTGTLTLLARAVAVAVAGALTGLVIDPERAYWIVTSGLAVVGLVLQRRVAVSRGLHRMIGTVGGAGVYFALVLVPWAGLWLAGLLGALQFIIELLIVRHYALALLFITPLVLILTGAATGDLGSTSTAAERVVDTVVGSALGMLAVLIPQFGRRAEPDAPA